MNDLLRLRPGYKTLLNVTHSVSSFNRWFLVLVVACPWCSQPWVITYFRPRRNSLLSYKKHLQWKVLWKCAGSVLRKLSLHNWLLLPNEAHFSDCCRDMRYLLCGVETAKRFVKVHFLCIVRNLKRMSKMSMFLPGKFYADAHALQQRYFQCKLRTVGNFYLLLYVHHKYNASSRTNHRDAKHLLLFTVVQGKSK